MHEPQQMPANPTMADIDTFVSSVNNWRESEVMKLETAYQTLVTYALSSLPNLRQVTTLEIEILCATPGTPTITATFKSELLQLYRLAQQEIWQLRELHGHVMDCTRTLTRKGGSTRLPSLCDRLSALAGLLQNAIDQLCWLDQVVQKMKKP